MDRHRHGRAERTEDLSMTTTMHGWEQCLDDAEDTDLIIRVFETLRGTAPSRARGPLHRYGARRSLVGMQIVGMPSWSTAVAANRLSVVSKGHRSTVASAA